MPIYIDDTILETLKFPGGECHVRLDGRMLETRAVDVLAYLYNSDDIMNLLLCINAIRQNKPQSEIILTIPYLPYARQDRVCNRGEALSIKVMSDLINSLNCREVLIYDPHSEVTPALLKNCKVVEMWWLVLKNLETTIFDLNLTLVSPDAGAEKKVIKVAKELSTEDRKIEFICATKIRDTLTGNITSTKIYGDVKGKNLIILDDICDGGRTFIELAKVLKEAGANDIYLYVTHGIFSQGLEVLKEHFKYVYCYHTMLPREKIDTSFLTIFKT